MPAKDGQPAFEIYRTDRVSLTSTLFEGGDWHWCFRSSDGMLISDVGGYKNRVERTAAAEALRLQACHPTIASHE